MKDPRRVAASKKAWETIRKNKKKPIMNYDRKEKNKVRCSVVKLFKSFVDKKKCILVLDNEQFLFSKELGDYSIHTCEFDRNVFAKMIKNKPGNVCLHYGNVKLMNNFSYGGAYLDFCCTWVGARKILKDLKFVLRKCHVVGFTFALRGKLTGLPCDIVKNHHDFKFTLGERLRYLLGDSFVLSYAKSYKDGSPMVTLVYNKIFSKDVDDVFCRSLKEKVPTRLSLLSESVVFLKSRNINISELVDFLLDSHIRWLKMCNVKKEVL